MFSRIVKMNFKPNHVNELTKLIDSTILPSLRKQEGFKDAMFFADATGTEGMAISLWDRKENAEAYGNTNYPQVLQTLAPMLDGTPQVKTSNVINSTFHKVVAAV